MMPTMRRDWAKVTIFLCLTALVGGTGACKTTRGRLLAATAPNVAASLLYGPEFEFVARDPATGAVRNRTSADLERYVAQILADCKKNPALKCTETELDDSALGDHAVTLQSLDGQRGFTIYLVQDPAVVEVKLSPLSFRATEENLDLIQTYVFDAAAAVDLTVPPAEENRWSNHLNFSTEAMRKGEDAEFLLRVFVDFANHPELNMGAFGGDLRNAPAYSQNSQQAQDKLRQIIADFQAHPDMSLPQLAKRLMNEAYDEMLYYSGSKFQTLNIDALSYDTGPNELFNGIDSRRIEVRGHYMDASAKAYLLSLSVLDGRLRWLDQQRRENVPISYKGKFAAFDYSKFRTSGLQDGVTGRAIATPFLAYLTDTGADIDAFVSAMPNKAVQRSMQDLMATSAGVDAAARSGSDSDSDSPDRSAAPTAEDTGGSGDAGRTAPVDAGRR